MYNFDHLVKKNYATSSSESSICLPLILYDKPFIFIISLWCTSLSIIAAAITLSPKTLPHFENGWLVVIIVDRFSYLAAISWKNTCDVSLSTGK